MGSKPTIEKLEKKIQELEKKSATRKLLDKHKRELDAQLQKNFAASIAHDFNNLLMSIQANISLMLLEFEPGTEHFERLTQIERHIQSGARLTSRLLIQAKEESFEIKALNLNQMIEEITLNFCKVQKQITINREFDSDLYLIKANSGQIEQMLFNLLIFITNNMIHDGELNITTSNTTSQQMKGKKYDPKAGNYVLLSVIALDKYIEQNILDHIFEPPLVSSMEIKGPNLNLASIYGTVKSYGGYIDVEILDKAGTKFSIYYPASENKIKKIIEKTEKFQKETGTILLVDDEEAFLEVGQELLEAMGYNVLTAKNGKEALEQYKKNLKKVGLIILDIVMPIMGGGETFDRLKKINPDIKVLLASGYSVDGEATDILNRGCNDFIQKPFKMSDLSKKITEIITQM